jgi:hypothetical protein
VGKKPSLECVRPRCDRGGNGCNCRCGGGSRPTFCLRSAHDSDLCCEPSCAISLESTRAGSYRVCRGCGFTFTPYVTTHSVNGFRLAP